MTSCISLQINIIKIKVLKTKVLVTNKFTKCEKLEEVS